MRGGFGRIARASVFWAAAVASGSADAQAQWSQVHEQFYLPAGHNWVFRDHYRTADRLFNAFDYGHAILYETLYRKPDAPASVLEEDEYRFITQKLLVKPPRLPLEEGAIEIAYARLAPEAKAMFEWAHILHRQLYDVLADERLTDTEKDRAVEDLLRYYRSRTDVAFSSQPKSMELMEGQYYSTAFRRGYPKFNGLIWAYHWLQVGLYEPLLVGRNLDERQTGVTATVARFWHMIEDPPTNMPRVMPMTAAVAPVFAERYPEAAIIFDNLHSMHDVISDMLASPEVPQRRKRDEILSAVERYRDNTSFVTTVEEWRAMTAHMGVENMGGPAVGLLPDFPTPTLERGAVMAGMDPAAMQHAPARADSAAAHQGHAMPGARQQDTAAAGHAAHAMPDTATDSRMEQMMEMHRRMMADPVIRERIMNDTALARMMQEMHGDSTRDAMDHAARTDATPADAAAREAMEFVLLLLSDPAVESRIHADPRLHRLWSDPGVQRCLSEMRRLKAAGQPLPAACPQDPAAQPPPASRRQELP